MCGPSTVGELPTLRLAGLDLAATTGLLQERASSDVSPAVAAQLLASTGGNPLALVEMPQALSSDQLAGRASLPGQLPVTATIERVFLDRARRLSPGAQQLLLVAAADDSMQLATVESAAAATGAGPDALAEAERSGLVQVTGGKVELRHPLVRSALYAAATSIDRRHVHAALADALRHPDDADRRAWHRASSVDQPDADVVADLERAAGRAEARGGHEAAAAAWERAAELSTDATGRAQRLFNASRSAWLAGRPVRARALVDSARAAAEDPLLLADVIRLRARVEWNTGSVKVAHRMLLEGARDVVRHDADRAREMAMVAAAIAAFGGDSGVDVDPATFATIPSDASERQRCYAELTLGLGEVVAGDWDAASAMLRRSFATGGRLDLDDLELLPNLGIAALHLGDTLASADYHQRLLTTARSSGAAVTVLYALTRLAFSDVPNGRWATAVAQQQEALRLGEGTGQPVLAAMPLATLVLLSALRGDDAYDQQLEGLERVLEEQPVGVLDMVLRDVTRWAKGLHAAPAWPTAFHHLAQISHPIIRRSAGIDRVEAAVYADQSETARLWIDDLETFSAATGQPWAAAMAAHGRAVLAVSEDEDDAESWFEQALALHADSVRPFERARTQLAYGEHLRRQRRRVDARVAPAGRPRDLRGPQGPALGRSCGPGAAGLGRERTQARPGNGARAHPDRAAGRAAGAAGPVQPRGRCPALREPPHRRLPPAQRLRQDRHQLPWCAHPAVADVTPARRLGRRAGVTPGISAGGRGHRPRCRPSSARRPSARAVRAGVRRPRRTRPGGRRPARPGW